MSKGTPTHKVRIEPELWAAATAKAAEDGIDGKVSTVLREALKAWLGRSDARYDLFMPPPRP